MTNNHNWRRILSLLFAFGLLAAACGDDDAATTTTTEGGGAGGDSIASGVDLSGLSFTVGSKDFTEQLVLGEMIVQTLEASGAEVDNQTNLGGTVVNRDALLSGDIDMYWEYNGTGWQVHLEQPDPSFDPEQLTKDVRELDLKENDIQWIGRSPFNDTYGFATPPDGLVTDLQGMADALAADDSLKVCLETEFPTRDDGLVLFETATGFELPESQIEILETGVIYSELAAGNCDFGEVFTTDGRVAGLDLNLVEDPGVFILYNASLTLPTSVYEQAPEGIDTLVAAILDGLDEATMTELNRLVSIEGEDAAEVAKTYLTDKGVI